MNRHHGASYKKWNLLVESELKFNWRVFVFYTFLACEIFRILYLSFAEPIPLVLNLRYWSPQYYTKGCCEKFLGLKKLWSFEAYWMNYDFFKFFFSSFGYFLQDITISWLAVTPFRLSHYTIKLEKKGFDIFIGKFLRINMLTIDDR